MPLPFVIERNENGERAYDLYSRLLEDRIVFLTGVIDTDEANSIIAQLLLLEKRNPERDISLYINSPGGAVTDGLAIYDAMNYVKCDVSTICVGLAASMGAFLLSSGAKGKRFALANSEIMIHQPSGGVSGQATEIAIAADRILRIKRNINRILAENAGQSVERIEKDAERDFYMTASEAKDYGIIDAVFVKREE